MHPNGTPYTARPIIEGRLLPLLLAFGYAIGICWTFLPPGLQFNPDSSGASATAAGDGGGLFALQWLPLIALGGAAIAMRFRFASIFVRDLNPWMVALHGWAFVTMLWAPEPFKVFKQSVAISGIVLLAIGFGLHGWSTERFSTVVRALLLAALGLSLVVGVMAPAIGVHSEDAFELRGSWRGITYQKNGLGQLAALGLILFTHSVLTRSGSRWLVIAGMMLSLLLLLLSRSSTSLLLSIIACGVIVLRLREPVSLGALRPTIVVAGWLMVLAPLFIYLMFIGSVDSQGIAQAFGQIFGKDATFSGRTEIWAEVIRNIRMHPMLGIGFNSFWFTPQADETIRILGWPCPSGHNGYLDVWNTLGMVGLVMLLAFLVRQFGDIARLARFETDRAVLHFALLLYVILANLTESGWYTPGAFTHLVAVYSSVTVSRLLFDQRLRLAMETRRGVATS